MAVLRLYKDISSLTYLCALSWRRPIGARRSDADASADCRLPPVGTPQSSDLDVSPQQPSSPSAPAGAFTPRILTVGAEMAHNSQNMGFLSPSSVKVSEKSHKLCLTEAKSGEVSALVTQGCCAHAHPHLGASTRLPHLPDSSTGRAVPHTRPGSVHSHHRRFVGACLHNTMGPGSAQRAQLLTPFALIPRLYLYEQASYLANCTHKLLFLLYFCASWSFDMGTSLSQRWYCLELIIRLHL